MKKSKVLINIIFCIFIIAPFVQACKTTTGSHIAYLSVENNNRTHISIVDDNGKNKVNLKTGSVQENCPSWSADGERLIFSVATDTEIVINRSFNLYTIRMDGAELNQLTRGENHFVFASWSPDGSRILFSAKDGNGTSIYIMNHDGTNIIKLTKEGFLMNGFPQWSPDEKRFVFSSNPSQGRYENPYYSIFTMNSDGSGLAQLTTEKEIDDGPVWSPDGRQIAFYATYEYHLPGEGPMFWKKANLFIMNADGSNKHKITDSPEPILDISPGWSPDGRKIVFASNRDHLDSPNIFDIYTINADGTDTSRITHDGNNRCPIWQP